MVEWLIMPDFCMCVCVLSVVALTSRRNPGWGCDSAVSVHPGVVNTQLANGFFKTQVGRCMGVMCTGSGVCEAIKLLADGCICCLH